MQLQLPIAEYEFTYQAADSICFPDYSGSLWHSVLGKALRELSCNAPNNKCENCMYSSQCDYSGLFHGITPLETDVIQTGSNIPSPHIIQITQPQQHIVKEYQNFTVKIILAGNAVKYLETLIRAMFIAGQSGFGQARNKAKLIKVVEQKNNKEMIVFDENTPLKTSKSRMLSIPVSPSQASLKFITPYKPTGKSAEKTYFEVDRFIMSIIRRLSLMQYFTTGKQLKGDFQALKQLTETVPVQTNIQWQKNTHQTRNNVKQNYKHGWIGQIIFDLEQHDPLWQFLYMGQWLHAGKNASMGFGQYKVTCINTD